MACWPDAGTAEWRPGARISAGECWGRCWRIGFPAGLVLMCVGMDAKGNPAALAVALPVEPVGAPGE